MRLDGHVDVVVIGFGMNGVASAALAAQAGARVLLLDQGIPGKRKRPASSRAARSREALRTDLWRAARAAGVEVRAQCRVHELMVDGGKVCGVGYAMLPSGGIVPAGHRLLRTMSHRLPERFAPVAVRAADAVWRSTFRVGEVGCFRVVLALSPRHWEFVGPATWAAARGLDAGRPRATRSPRRLCAVVAADAGGRPTPELTVRAWCASRDAMAPAAATKELSVDEATGEVLVSENRRVRGLYTAVHVDDAEVAHFWGPAALSGSGASVLGRV
jgi:hypothetical protein